MRTQEIQGILIRQPNNLGHALPDLCDRLGLPFAELGVQRLDEDVHLDRTCSLFYAISGIREPNPAQIGTARR
jgi:hypothetical protein